MNGRRTIAGAIERFVHAHAARLAGVVTIAVLAFLWLPIGVLVFMSFADGGVLSFPPDQLTLRWYRVFLENEAARGAIVTTLTISVPSTILTVTLATMTAYAVIVASVTVRIVDGTEMVSVVTIAPRAASFSRNTLYHRSVS